MRSWLTERLTFANVISVVAVFLALGGSAYAALGRNSVGPRQLKRNAVTTTKIKRGAVTTARIKGNAVTGAKIRDSTLTDRDIAVETLGQVQSAANAETVGGQSVAKFFRRIAPDAPEVTVLDFGGVRLTGGCGGGLTDLLAANSSGETAASVFHGVAAGDTATSAFASPHVGAMDLTDLLHFAGSGTLDTAFTGGRITTVHFSYVSSDFGAPGCLIFGHALTG
jgi:hypothetical protein